MILFYLCTCKKNAKYLFYNCKMHTFAAERDKQPHFCSIMKADMYLIKLERFNMGLTQVELAKKASISLATVQKAERGGSISPRSNKAIWDALKKEEQS